MSRGTVIVGAGQAGAQLALSLRENGYRAPVTLIGDETDPPYQRPPLSKDYLAGELRDEELPLRPAAFYAEQDIDLITGTRAVAIDRGADSVTLADGRTVGYEQLVLATGARNRELPLGDSAPANVHGLRTRGDARRLRRALAEAKRVLIVGAGFIGLEFAAVARTAGARVTVVEAAERVMSRVVSPEISRYFAERHGEAGVQVRCGGGVDEFLRDECGSVTAVRIGQDTIETDLVLLGIGVVANDELAAEAGLDTAGGVVVDGRLRTADASIRAIGDCARYPRLGQAEPVRVESVQNAADQARYVARAIAGGDDPGYGETPWFWSQQGGDKLQISGLATQDDEAVPIGDAGGGRFSVARIRDGVLVAVESVNSAGDHLAARRLLSSGARVPAEAVRASGFSLREALRSAASGGTTREHVLERSA